MSDALQWEINWINKNIDMYDSPMHAKAVIGNITKRYAANKVKRLVEVFTRKRTTGSMLDLLEHFGILEI